MQPDSSAATLNTVQVLGDQETRWDFFVSYSQPDRDWAEWTAWHLEAAGYRVLVQAWDFVPGSRWVAEVAAGVEDARHTIALVSRSYLRSHYGQLEWHDSVAADPKSRIRRLIPVRIEHCPLPGLLRQFVAIDLVGLAAAEARDRLLSGVDHASTGRAKPTVEPAYPTPDNSTTVRPAPRWPAARSATGLMVGPEHGLEVVPHQLPPDTADFTGREEYLPLLHRLLGSPARQDGAVVLTAIAGKAGVGKTTLAVHVGHQLTETFPDGQLYVDLRGADAGRVDPSTVLPQFLRALSVPAALVPAQVEEAATLYRSITADRTLLVVLDNAKDERQVRPLLPSGERSKALITSRRRLAAIEGAETVPVDVFTKEQGLNLLRRIVSVRRVDLEVAAAEEVIELCGRLPLAVRIASARLAMHPEWTLASLRDRLADESRRLNELTVGDLEVRASFSLSYVDLEAEEQLAFRRLGAMPSTRITAHQAALLFDLPAKRAGDLLTRLVEMQLIDGAGANALGEGTFVMHDLLRLFAHELLRADEDDGVRIAMSRRILQDHLRDARRLGIRPLVLEVEPGSSVAPGEADIAAEQEAPSDSVQVWGNENWPSIVRVVLDVLAARTGLDVVREFTALVAEIVESLGQWDDWRVVQEACLAAARGVGDRRWEHISHFHLATIDRTQGRTSEARRTLARCRAHFESDGDLPWLALIERELGRLDRAAGRPNQAVEHFETGLEVLHRSDGSTRLATVLSIDLADALRATGDGEQVARRLEAAVGLSRRSGDRSTEAEALRLLASAYKDLGQQNRSVGLLEDAIQILDARGEARHAAFARTSLGDIYRSVERWDDALRCYSEALPGLRRFLERKWEGFVVRARADIYLRQGRPDESVDLFYVALAVFEELDDPRWEAYVRSGLGVALTRTGQTEAGRQMLKAALDELHALGERRWWVRGLVDLGEIHREAGDLALSHAALRTALDEIRALQDRRYESSCLAALARTLEEMGLVTEAAAIRLDIGKP